MSYPFDTSFVRERLGDRSHDVCISTSGLAASNSTYVSKELGPSGPQDAGSTARSVLEASKYWLLRHWLQENIERMSGVS